MSWIAVFATNSGETAGRRVVFDSEDWTFLNAEKAAQQMADEENTDEAGLRLHANDPNYLNVKLYTEEQLAALNGPEEQTEDLDWAAPIHKALKSLQLAAKHNRTNKRAVKELSELVPRFLAEYAELTKLANTMMAAWESLKRSEQLTEGVHPSHMAAQPRTSSGLVLASTADVAAVRQRKGL